MVVYNFKKITPVPSATALVDAILSKTQRKTPTVVHPGYNIVRIRQFYMRKVKYTHTNYAEALTQILTDFPRLDDIHPFYADLINVLYDRDHVQLALGQLNLAKQLIDRVGRDYVKLLKYGDSLYRCKSLKRAALGRMCTVMKRQKGALEYLEQVRQHMMRLPSIDPTTRTLILAGFPNVGKSSFMNCVSRANVDVQPYAFTTKSLFVGHLDYKFLRWQIIDTPGVLDKPLEERNTIEMQSITALAHLHCAVVYVLDISEECGYTIAQQVALFDQIRPLFHNKPLVVAVNKIDARAESDLRPDERQLLDSLRDAGATVAFMSTLAQDGISRVKTTACDLLLAQRVEQKLKGSRVEQVIGRIRVAEPAPPVGAAAAAARPSYGPASVVAARAQRAEAAARKAAATTTGAAAANSSTTSLPDAADDDDDDDDGDGDGPAGGTRKRRLAREVEEELGGAGVYSRPLQTDWELKRPEWVDDMIPEIMDGKNIADYVDPEIDAKLAELEAEEEERAQLAALEAQATPMDDETAEAHAQVARLAKMIRKKKGVIKEKGRLNRSSNHPTMPRGSKGRRGSLSGFVSHLADVGIEATPASMPNAAAAAARGEREAGFDEESRGRSLVRDGMEVDGAAPHLSKAAIAKRKRSVSKDRSAIQRDKASVARSRSPAFTGLSSEAELVKMEKLARKKTARIALMGRAGESDRRIPERKPRHLNSGKRGQGKTDRR